MNILSPHLFPGRHGVTWTAISVLFVGIIITFTAAIRINADIQDVASQQFERRADRLLSEIERRVNLPVYGLMGARGLYLASQAVSRLEYRAYALSRDLPREFPGVLGFGFIERVMREDLKDFIARERADNAPDFDVRTSGNAEDLYVIKYIDPLERNRAAWGYDVGSESRRRQSVEKAVETGKPTITAPIQLVQDDAKLSAFLYMVPIYLPGLRLASRQDHFDSLYGLVYSPVIVRDIFADLSPFVEDLLDFEIFDGDNMEKENEIFDLDAHLANAVGTITDEDYRGRRFVSRREIIVGNRTWTIQVSSTAVFDMSIDRKTPRLIGISGTLLSLLLSALVWSLGIGRARAVNLARSMTRDLARAKQMAESANESKSRFLANMSHEIRTPLTAIIGYAQILREQETGPKQEEVEVIHESGVHLLTLINDILDLSKIEAGKLSVEFVETSLSRMILDVEQMIRPRAEQKGITLDHVLECAIPERVVVDPTRLRQILVNMVGNSVKFTDRGNVRVKVSTSETEDRRWLRFAVEDTGLGMTDEVKTRLFSPFDQGDDSVARKFGGTGLGLTISRRLAEMMGGRLWLDYSEVGRGSQFVLEIPFQPVAGASLVSSLEPDSDSKPSTVSTSPDALSGVRILVVEDSVVNQKLVSFHLSRAGADVALTDNGKQALEMLDASAGTDHAFRLVLSDIQMPEMDGYTLLQHVRERGHTIPTIALTANAMLEDRTVCLAAGFSDYLSKPLNPAAMVDACRRWSSVRIAP